MPRKSKAASAPATKGATSPAKKAAAKKTTRKPKASAKGKPTAAGADAPPTGEQVPNRAGRPVPGRMTILCTLGHMKGKTVNVNGTSYRVGPEGWLRDVLPQHAAKLLTMQGYRELKGRGAQGKRFAATAPAPTVEEPKVHLLTGDGQRVEDALAAMDAGVEPPVTIVDRISDTSRDPPIPGPDEEWPDPDPQAQSLSFLHQMAKAHGVDFDPTQTPDEVAEAIRFVVYG